MRRGSETQLQVSEDLSQITWQQRVAMVEEITFTFLMSIITEARGNLVLNVNQYSSSK